MPDEKYLEGRLHGFHEELLAACKPWRMVTASDGCPAAIGLEAEEIRDAALAVLRTRIEALHKQSPQNGWDGWTLAVDAVLALLDGRGDYLYHKDSQ